MNNLDEQIAHLAWNGRTEGEAIALIGLLGRKNGSSWRPVGGRENNAGIINVSTSPGAAIVERITNAADAELELAYELSPTKVASPTLAATYYYGVPAEGVGAMSETARRVLGEKIRVSLEDSGVETRPTVVVTDLGIGQTAAALPRTILSLGESNKLSSLHLMGSYNQGGSASLSFARATIIVSRRHPQLLGGAEDRVAITVVEQRDDPRKKVPNYEYLTDGAGNIVTLDPALFPRLTHGTRIIHVRYDLQIKGPWTTQPYMFLQAALPSMPLPFVLGGTRTKPADPPGDRVILGNAARLDNAVRARGDIEVAHKDSHDINLGARGSVRIRYWVVRRPAGSTSSSDPTASYVEASNAISLTLNGQRQEFEARAWINNRAKLPFIYRNILVQIEADGLTRQAKKELFASTRERARQSDMRSEIYDTLAVVLRGDEELHRLDEEERERLLRKSSDTVNEKVRKKLGRFIKHVLKDTERPGRHDSLRSDGGSGGYAPRHRRTDPPPGPRPTDDSHLPESPTYMRFAKEALTVAQGRRAQLWVEIDAKNDYLPLHNEDLTITIEGPADGEVRVAARSALTAGRSRWLVQADTDAPLGDYKLAATLDVDDAVLAASLPVTVKPPPVVKKGENPGSEPDTGPNVAWVYRDTWPEGFTELTVGRVAESTTSTDILINRNYKALDDALSGPGLTEAMVKTRADRYQFPVACALWLQQHELKQLPTGEARPSELWQESEMRRIAEAVLLAMTPDANLAGQQEAES
jgi:hypothetical protein